MASATMFRPNRTSFAIMQLVHGYFSHQKHKPWTLMSQAWMLEQLENWYQVKIARSTLNYNLAILRREGLIQTVTRHKRCPKTRQFICQVTLYKASPKLKKFFSRLASYFKRCKWVPNVKALAAGHLPVVGAATTREAAHAAVVEEKRRRRRGSG